MLRRELGLRDVVLLNVAAVVGIRWLAAAAHTGPGSITLWLLAALLFFMPSALCVAALSRRFPEEGGIYVWTRHGFGDWHGFLCGWCYWVSNLFYFPGLLLAGVGMAASALGFAESRIWLVAISLAALWIAAADPAEPAERFVQFTGRPIRQQGEVVTIPLERGTIRVATPGYLQRELGIEPGPLLPYLAAYEVEIVSLPQLAKLLGDAGLVQLRVRDGVAVSLPPPIGGTILFRDTAV